MTFPLITNIRQARAAIENRPEFSETDKGDYIVFNYHVSHEDSFDDPIRRELRGLIFSPSGDVISRPFHKFFNLNEKEETRNVDWSIPHHVLNKLDGSMLRPIPLPSGIRWGTKMGITDVSKLCEQYVSQHPRYNAFAVMCIDRNSTPIFEYIAPHNRIVLDYKYEDLVLLAIRENNTGRYLSVESMNMTAGHYDIPVVQPVRNPLDQIKSMTDIEGVVVRFDNGHMIKIKSEWYVAIHKAKENLLFEKNVIKMILEEKVDDILPNLPQLDIDRINAYKENLLNNIDRNVMLCHNALNEASGYDKKHFAVNIAPKLHPWLRVACFASWNDPSKLRNLMIVNILKKCGSQTDVDSIREIIGGKW
jgi:RNA ligase